MVALVQEPEFNVADVKYVVQVIVKRRRVGIVVAIGERDHRHAGRGAGTIGGGCHIGDRGIHLHERCVALPL